jgi:hypothetical protein
VLRVHGHIADGNRARERCASTLAGLDPARRRLSWAYFGLTFAGRPDQVREARAFVGRLLGPSHPCRDVAVLLASEMVTNSLLHGGSAGPGEAVMVTVVAWAAGVRVEVTGRKADGVPVLR